MVSKEAQELAHSLISHIKKRQAAGAGDMEINQHMDTTATHVRTLTSITLEQSEALVQQFEDLQAQLEEKTG